MHLCACHKAKGAGSEVNTEEETPAQLVFCSVAANSVVMLEKACGSRSEKLGLETDPRVA